MKEHPLTLHTVDRWYYLKRRREQIEEVRRETAFLGAENVIIIDPEDDIVCDLCNADVVGDIICFDDWGTYCHDCVKERRK